MSFTSWMFRNRPDQTVDTLNEMLTRLDSLNSSIRVVSKDKKNVIIIGNQPVNPQTGRPSIPTRLKGIDWRKYNGLRCDKRTIIPSDGPAKGG